MPSSKRALSQQQAEWLRRELDVWREHEVLSGEQAERLLALYESGDEQAERRRSVAMWMLMGLAGFLVGLAVFLLIGINWQAMPRAAKLAVIFTAVGAAHGLGLYLRLRRGARKPSEVAFFLGCLFYGAGIFLIAQIFHLNAHYPDGVWWWALGVLPLALCLDTMLLHVLLVALLATWCGLEIIGFHELGAWFFRRWAAVPNGAYSLPVLALPGLVWAYRKRSLWTVALYVPLLTWWVLLQPFAWRYEERAVFFVGAAGALLLMLAESHMPGSRFAVPYRFYGGLLTVLVLAPLSFHQMQQELYRQMATEGGALSQGVIILLVTCGVIVLVSWLRRDGVRPFAENLVMTFKHLAMPAALAALMALLPLGYVLSDRVLLPTVWVNVAMVLYALWLMRIGLREDQGRPFAFGVLTFLLWAVLRYGDLFGNFGGMLGAALMFLFCGGTLFGVALFWRRRKEARHA